MGNSSLSRHEAPLTETAGVAPSSDSRHLAALVAAIGFFLLFTGPAFAVLALFMAVDAPIDVAGALATAHVLGLIAGLLGGVLLLGASAWLLLATLARRRPESRDAA